MSPSPPWWQAVGYALLGRELAAPDPAMQTTDPCDIVAWLRRHGVDSSQIAAERTRCLAQRMPWPHRPPEVLREGIGAAQLAALVDKVRALTVGAPIPEVSRPRPGVVNLHDQRLIADKPPHHG